VCGDIDSVAIKVAALDHDVAQVDSHAKHDPAIFWQIHVGCIHGLLKLDCAGNGIYGAGELD
jgi:hypothetical protein